MKVGDKVRVARDIPSVNGMLRRGSVVKIDEMLKENMVKDNIATPGNIRAIDALGGIWWVEEKDLTSV